MNIGYNYINNILYNELNICVCSKCKNKYISSSNLYKVIIKKSDLISFLFEKNTSRTIINKNITNENITNKNIITFLDNKYHNIYHNIYKNNIFRIWFPYYFNNVNLDEYVEIIIEIKCCSKCYELFSLFSLTNSETSSSNSGISSKSLEESSSVLEL